MLMSSECLVDLAARLHNLHSRPRMSVKSSWLVDIPRLLRLLRRISDVSGQMMELGVGVCVVDLLQFPDHEQKYEPKDEQTAHEGSPSYVDVDEILSAVAELPDVC